MALLTAFATPVAAQQTVIIGGPAIIGPGAGGLIINNEVLESLGSGPQAPALSYQAPGGGFGGAPVMPVTPGFMSGPNLSPGVGPNAVPGVGLMPGIAYRQPNTGQLLVTRPGRLLFPPARAPKSLLAAGGTDVPQAKPELTSRLLVPAPPIQSAPVEPVLETPLVETPVVETPVVAAQPSAPPPAPEPQVAAQPEPAQPEPAQPEPAQPEPAQPEPALAAPNAPEPSPLTEELTRETAPAGPSQEPAAVAKAEPTPPPAAVVQPATPPLQPPPVPAAPATAPATAGTEPPPPPDESLTSGPAVEPQTAALPSAPALAEQIRVLFQDGSVELSSDAKRQLSTVAKALKESATLRVQLLAYAKASSDGTSRARRLSLSRALAVRAYLIERGVRSTRMDVRALGDKIGDGPADRVDIRPQAAN